MATTSQAFYCLWQEERIREQLFELLSKEDICNVRLASSACCNVVTKRLFLRTNLTFSSNTFTRECRIKALSRIGHHIEHLTFHFPHSDATFLPPLIHPSTGKEISFLYTPHTSMASVLTRPKYANTELGDILTQQYPPLFHAASNVPSFMNAAKHLPNLRHLTIKTPGQDPKERYRRDIVDYALISLRVALERTPLEKLRKLTLSSVHPSAFMYLRHLPGFGCMPSATKTWRRIRKLHISAESWDFYGPSPGLDHLKMIEDFIRTFSPTLEKFTFTWLGRKGPCPLSLAADPLFAPSRNSKKLFNEVTSPMSPLPPTPVRKPVAFKKLRHLSVRNATMNAPQVADLVAAHQHSVREFDFENVILINAGSWDDALHPLMASTGSDHWSRHSTGPDSPKVEVGSFESDPFVEDCPSPSAAVAAASMELLDGPEPSDHLEDDLASDIAAAREASLIFSTNMKKRRITKKRRKKKHRHDHKTRDEQQELRPQTSESASSSLQSNTPTHKPSIFRMFSHSRKQSREHVDEGYSSRSRSNSDVSKPTLHRQQSDEGYHSRSGSRSELKLEPPTHIALSEGDFSPRHQPSQRQLFGELNISPISNSSRPRLFGEIAIEEEEDDDFRPGTPTPINTRFPQTAGQYPLTPLPESSPNATPRPRSHDTFKPRTPKLSRTYTSHSDPISPTSVYSPPPSISSPILTSQSSQVTLNSGIVLQPMVYDPTAELCSEITAVQRDLEAEETQRLMAEDEGARSNALKRAKEAVLNKLGKEFPKRPVAVGAGSGNNAYGASFGMGARLREGLFGKQTTASMMTDYSQTRSMDVPILFSRA